MSAERERLRDIEAAGQLPPEKRLQRLRARAARMEQNEAYWSVAEPLAALLDAAESLLKVKADEAPLLEALDGILAAGGLLLDGVE
jgi:hypothetical protein